MLRSFLVLQVIGCIIANGILTPESIPLPFFLRKTSANKHNWQLLLKSATFRTLSKYTDFTPSLDMKMEADTLLWEKLEEAKYIQKSSKQQQEYETIRTGLLVDMTRESGYLEFRQTDKSHYDFEPRDHRILTMWKVQKLDQNHYVIQIKIPQEPPIEDKYEYTLKDGLQEVNINDSSSSNNKKNESTKWKSSEGVSARSIEQTDYHQIERKDSYILNTQESNTNRPKLSDSNKLNKVTSRTYLYKPTQYYTLLGFQTPPPVSKFQTWKPPNDYYSVSNYKIFPEFKQDVEYNGFIPSIGPTGNPPIYQDNPLEPLPYRQYENYYPVPQIVPTNYPSPQILPTNYPSPQIVTTTYPSPQIVTTYPSTRIVTTHKPLPITYFKPSTQFIQYSEVDPFYATEDNYTHGSTITAEIPTVNPTPPSIGEYQHIFYKKPLPSIAIDIPPLNPGESLYDSVINTIKNVTVVQENTAEPTLNTLVINYPQNSNSFDEKQSTTELSNPVSLEIENFSTTDRAIKTNGQNNFKSPHLSSLIKVDNYDYAPLYIKWGEKIKSFENKTKITTQNSDISNQQIQNQNQLKELIPKEEANDYTDEIEIISDNEKNEEEEELTTLVANKIRQVKNDLNYSTTTAPTDGLNITNYVISNITIKSPEEIVTDLTTMGLVNSTNGVLDNRNKHFETDNLEKEKTHKHEDNQEEGSEPISVVVNRISQSYSYKTSVGHIGNLKQLPEKT